MHARWILFVTLLMTTPAAGAVEELLPATKPAGTVTEIEVAVEPGPEPIISPPPAMPATPEDAVRQALEGTAWDVKVVLMSGEGKPGADTISFIDGHVTSKNLAKAGYPSTNYTLTLREDGTASWETMQSQEGKGLVFWRGELGGATMRGVMSKRPAEGPTEDYGFSGLEATGKTIEIPAAAPAGSPAPVVIKQAAPKAPAAAPSAPDAPAPKKNKKGWF